MLLKKMESNNNKDFLTEKIKIMKKGVYVYTPLFGSAFIFSFLDILQRKRYYNLYILIPIIIYTIGYRTIYLTDNMLKLINKIVKDIYKRDGYILIDTTEGLWRKRKTYKLYSGSFNIEINPKYSETGELSQYMKYILKFQFNKRNIELFLSENLYSMIKEYEYFGNSKAS